MMASRWAFRVADDAARPHARPSDLELRLDEDDGAKGVGHERHDRRPDRRHRDERDVAHHEVGAPGQVVRRQMARVRALQHRDPRVVPKRPVELPVADVHGDDRPGARFRTQSVKPRWRHRGRARRNRSRRCRSRRGRRRASHRPARRTGPLGEFDDRLGLHLMGGLLDLHRPRGPCPRGSPPGRGRASAGDRSRPLRCPTGPRHGGRL